MSSINTKITLGPPGSQWIYDRPSRTYDLTRGQHTSPTALRVAVAQGQGPPGTSILLSPPATVLVVVDMQNFFLHPSCRAHPAGLAAVQPLLRTIARCREVGVQVVWLNWGLTEEDLEGMPAGVLRGFARTVMVAAAAAADGGGGGEEEQEKQEKQHQPPAAAGLGVDLGEGKGRCLVAGEWNSALYGPLQDVVREGDVHCAKNRMSGLWCERQPLWAYLARNRKGDDDDDDEKGGKKTTLLFAGVNTDQCVLGTLTDAYNAGWDCVMVEDCCATTTQGAKEVCLYNVANNYGFVIDSKTFTEAVN
ncbi:hypothetical protein M406DRAFT_70938 [Cryphonectria parasitica EP155]|uniref:Isochorismatase-like domain-containing protein n=1 Tax=Cryphonectria parasitica (strain ATCC 38755 / EP155) TaxID=660469 RepID=A0A9P5CNP0_CRYP1|nr:uncharacterized protein M406DRAFT_70938 [Cryphonectria parasitica EP155]KAF3764522.1 hypothetical protein M406DRAFT_70938 [Cryphonectria parasitica EP155]